MPRDGSSCIRAVVRVRPLLPSELSRGEQACCEVKDATSLLIRSAEAGKWRQYTFDACLPSDRTQKQVFQESGVINLLDAAIEGYAGTILAYGQTGSGKTHTILGQAMDGSTRREDAKLDEGLVMRSAKRLFRKISGHGRGENPGDGPNGPDADSGTSFSISASFTEIYNAPGAVNECICDLLAPTSGNLQVRHSQKHGFFINELQEIQCHSAADVRAVLEAGVQNRRVGSTQLNRDSSRSHALFTLRIDSRTPSATGCDATLDGSSPTMTTSANARDMRRYGKITFVDLAGSERLKESLAEGHRAKEAQAINKSLFTLGNVISHLSQGKNQQHVPYRDSKLTQLLQESFGGGALCLMVTCLNPGASFWEESSNSLNYAQKAMSIRNRPVVRLDEQQQLVHDLKLENANLKRELEVYRSRFGQIIGRVDDAPDTPNTMRGVVQGSYQPAASMQANPQGAPSSEDARLFEQQQQQEEQQQEERQQQMQQQIQLQQAAPAQKMTKTSGSSTRGHSAPPPPILASSAAGRNESLGSARAAAAQPTHPNSSHPNSGHHPTSHLPHDAAGTPNPTPPPPAPSGASAPASLSARSGTAEGLVGSYAMVAAKRRELAEQQQHQSQRKRVPRDGRPLPPLPTMTKGTSAGGSSSKRRVQSPAGASSAASVASAAGDAASPQQSLCNEAGTPVRHNMTGASRPPLRNSRANSPGLDSHLRQRPGMDQAPDPNALPLSLAPLNVPGVRGSVVSSPRTALESSHGSFASMNLQAMLKRSPSYGEESLPRLTSAQLAHLDKSEWSDWQVDFAGGPGHRGGGGGGGGGGGSRVGSGGGGGGGGGGEGAHLGRGNSLRSHSSSRLVGGYSNHVNGSESPASTIVGGDRAYGAAAANFAPRSSSRSSFGSSIRTGT